MTKGQRIGYIRVSTFEQNSDRQLVGIELDKKFIDKASGKDLNREQLQLMLEYVREGDIIYVHSLDRLSRNVEDLRSVVFSLIKRKISIAFVKEGLICNSESTSDTTFFITMFSAFAELQRAKILESQMEGIHEAKKRGAYKGKKKKLNDTQESELKSLVAQNWRKTDIAKHFNMHRTSIYGYIKKNKEKI